MAAPMKWEPALAAVLFLALLQLADSVIKPPYYVIGKSLTHYTLPSLPFGHDDLEPYIDAATLRVHHEGHHAAYTKKMNVALKQWRDQAPQSNLAKSSILEIIEKLHMAPDNLRKPIQNNGGGFVNHLFYWACMSKNPTEEPRLPSGKVEELITKSFSSYTHFKSLFTKQASELFGSGYVWLVRNPDDEEDTEIQPLSIVTTVNQDSPITLKLRPILVIDVWEHAYYLKHQNKRANHIEDWWKVVDWDNVERLYNWWDDVEAELPETEKDEL